MNHARTTAANRLMDMRSRESILVKALVRASKEYNICTFFFLRMFSRSCTVQGQVFLVFELFWRSRGSVGLCTRKQRASFNKTMEVILLYSYHYIVIHMYAYLYTPLRFVLYGGHLCACVHGRKNSALTARCYIRGGESGVLRSHLPTTL